jgi:hypothetical protein
MMDLLSEISEADTVVHIPSQEYWSLIRDTGKCEASGNGKHYFIVNTDEFKMFWEVGPAASPRCWKHCERKALVSLRTSFTSHKFVFLAFLSEIQYSKRRTASITKYCFVSFAYV